MLMKSFLSISCISLSKRQMKTRLSRPGRDGEQEEELERPRQRKPGNGTGRSHSPSRGFCSQEGVEATGQERHVHFSQFSRNHNHINMFVDAKTLAVSIKYFSKEEAGDVAS